VAGDHVVDRRAQRLDVQCPGHPEGDRHVVGGRPTLEPVQEPQSALGERQWNLGRPLTSHQRLTPPHAAFASFGVGPDPLCTQQSEQL
jgi:hypothetical protein